tara:strand:+ start:3363 stop:4172 length:810 start_codon:yes stop_codon:yes gene_type:complete
VKRIPNYPQQPDAWWSLPDDPQTLRAGLTGMSGSFVLHGVTLLALSLLVLEQWHDPAPLSTEWTQSDEGPPSLPESAAGVLELESVVDQKHRPPKIDTALLEGREHVLEEALSDVMADFVSDFDSENSGSGGSVLKAPDGKRVVKKGSFSVWTVPKDPLPEQEYQIVIQVRLPNYVRRYRATDLTGEVEGSDRYRQKIPWDPKWKKRTDVALTVRKGRLVALRRGDFLPVRDRVAQLVIRVPPAKRLVRDRIRIQSKLLKEQQVLEIVF